MKFGAVQRRVPHLRRILRVTEVSKGRKCLVEIYDGCAHGLAFETIRWPEMPPAGACCRAILVHEREGVASLFDGMTLNRMEVSEECPYQRNAR